MVVAIEVERVITECTGLIRFELSRARRSIGSHHHIGCVPLSICCVGVFNRHKTDFSNMPVSDDTKTRNLSKFVVFGNIFLEACIHNSTIYELLVSRSCFRSTRENNFKCLKKIYRFFGKSRMFP